MGNANYSHQVLAPNGGYINKVNTEGYGVSALLLGAGRNKLGDKIDYTAGIILNKKTGDRVEKGEVIATLYANDPTLFIKSEQKLLESTEITPQKPVKRQLILARID